MRGWSTESYKVKNSYVYVSGTKRDPKLNDLSFIYKEKSLELIQVNWLWLGLGLIKIFDVGKRSTVNCDALINQAAMSQWNVPAFMLLYLSHPLGPMPWNVSISNFDSYIISDK